MTDTDPRVEQARDALDDTYHNLYDSAVVRDLLAVVDEMQAKLDELTPTDPTLCATCGCNDQTWAEGCTCPDRGCGCWEARQVDGS